MRKLFFLFLCMSLFFNFALGGDSSIKPKKGTKGLSFSIKGLSSLGVGGVGAGIGGKCWRSDKLVYKLSFGFKSESSSSTAPSSGSFGENLKYFFDGSFSILPGIEYHYFPTKRISPYWGTGLSLSVSNTIREYFPPSSPFYSALTRFESRSYSGGTYLALGIEWFIIKNLSIAGEYQVNFYYQYTKRKEIKTISKISGEQTQQITKTTSKAYSLNWGTSALVATFYF